MDPLTPSVGRSNLVTEENLNRRLICCLNHPQGANDNFESCLNSVEELTEQFFSGLKELMLESLSLG